MKTELPTWPFLPWCSKHYTYYRFYVGTVQGPGDWWPAYHWRISLATLTIISLEETLLEWKTFLFWLMLPMNDSPLWLLEAVLYLPVKLVSFSVLMLTCEASLTSVVRSKFQHHPYVSRCAYSSNLMLFQGFGSWTLCTGKLCQAQLKVILRRWWRKEKIGLQLISKAVSQQFENN